MRFGDVGLRLVFGAVAAVLLGVSVFLSKSGSTDSIWRVAAGLNPGAKLPGIRPPFNRPDVNPFALYGSPLGIFFSGLCNQSGNTAEHMGMPSAETVLFQTFIGNVLDSIYRGMAPSVHTHASATGASNGVGVRAEAKIAARLVSERLERAYLLDPTNPQAFVAIETAMVDSDNPKSRSAGIELAKHALASYRVDSGYWPEQCLQACQTLVILWNAVGQPKGGFLVALDKRVHSLLEKGDEQKQKLEARGLWQKRRPYQRAAWDENIRYIRNLSTLIHKAVEDQQKDTKKTTVHALSF